MASLVCSLALGALVRPQSFVQRPPVPLRAPRPVALAGGDSLLNVATLLADGGEEVRGMTEEAIKAASGELGWWGTYIKTVEDAILTVHDTLAAAGVPFPYGVSIFLFILGVKLITLPLNFNQLSSAAQVKALKPQQDLVREWYGDNTQFLNMQVGMLYEKNDVNPLGGCLPSLVQIPVFLGVYYSVTAIAKAQLINEGFLWIPSLSGPIADRREGLSWLTEGWIDGAPKLGWHDTLAYLVIPVMLVVTQTVSLYLLGSFEALENAEDKTSKNAATALRILPLMIGWFAMNAPSGLGLYWLFNNMLTTLQTVTIKKVLEKPPIEPNVDELLAELGPRRSAILEAGAIVDDFIQAAPEEPEAPIEAAA